VAACNPNAPGARMSEALLSRFAVQFEVQTDYKLARKLGVDAKVVTAAQNLASKLGSGEVGWAPQLRELLDYKRVADEFGQDIALNNLVSVAPEIDRAVVADVVTRVVGKTAKALVID
jgi:nitric oxide reductase NorQ protein